MSPTPPAAVSHRGGPARGDLPGRGRLQVVLLLLCLLAAGGAGAGLSGWTRLLCAATAAAIPGAVAVGHGRAAVRTLLGLPPPDAPDNRIYPSEELTEHDQRSATASR